MATRNRIQKECKLTFSYPATSFYNFFHILSYPFWRKVVRVEFIFSILKNFHVLHSQRMLTNGGQKRPLSLKDLSHRSYSDETGTVISYLKKIQKIYESRDTPHVTSAFFTGNQQTLLYQEEQIEIPFWYIITNSFNFFQDCFKKHG